MKDFFGKDASALRKKRLFLLDMDGTVYLGDRLFEGVLPFLKTVERYVFITNNSSRSVDDYVRKVRRMGIEADERHFYTSAQAAAELLRGSRVYCQGTRSMIAQLRGFGLDVTESEDDVDAILVGFDTELTFEKLTRTCRMLLRDVPYYATNPDRVCPTEDGFVPDCGSMCRLLETATGRVPTYIGKPQPTMIETVMRRLGYARSETVVIGDRLYTDVASGVNAGVDTVCVLSGETTPQTLADDAISPTYVFEDINAILRGIGRSV